MYNVLTSFGPTRRDVMLTTLRRRTGPCGVRTTTISPTCTLRDGVKFHDGADLDANDVVLSYAAQWDAEHELHVGRSGAFEYFPGLWGGFLNPPPPSS